MRDGILYITLTCAACLASSTLGYVSGYVRGLDHSEAVMAQALEESRASGMCGMAITAWEAHKCGDLELALKEKW
jgi:hypothetical protein